MLPDLNTLLGAVTRFNQDQRLIRVHATLDGETLMAHSLDTVEEVSRPYELRLVLLSPYAHLELKSLVGQPMGAAIATPQGTDRFFHGYVREFARTGSDGGFVRYEAKVVPWFWFLRHRTNCRIFQDDSVIGIARKLFADYGDLAQARFDLAEADYPVLPYCVQYNESDFDFVSRLLEDAGIHYRFEHAQDGHTLVLADDSTQGPPQPQDPLIRFHGDQGTLAEDVMDDWTARRSVGAGARSLKTFDFKQPANPLASSSSKDIPRGVLPLFEAYEYDGAASFVDLSLGDRRSGVRLEELAWRTKLYEGSGTSRLMQAGCWFELDEHFEHQDEDPNERRFFAVGVTYRARNNFLPDFSDAEPATCRGQVTAIRRAVPFRPERRPAPRMPGPQTATVVGPAGEELHADKFGRVKVQFHWDREGRSDERSSCYVRVASPWAGEGMGGVSIPRIGQEVVVDFLDGNPDRPIIVGRVYNASNMPPFGLEVSGLRSKTVKGGGYNEMTMHDAPGAQLLNMQAERNMNTLVKNDQSSTVQANKTTSVGADHTETIGANQTMTVQANRSATVNGNDTRTVQGTSTSTVTGAVTQTYNATQTRSVTSDYTETVGGNWASTLSGNYTGQTSGNWTDAITGTATWAVTGATTETHNTSRSVSVNGPDTRVANGQVDDANTGARNVSVDGVLTQASSGASHLHAEADMNLTSAAKVNVAVGGAAIVVDGGSITISAGGSTIKVDDGGVTVNGAKINLNS